MLNEKWRGVFPALITPFTKEGALNADALAPLMEWNLQKGVTGFYVGGSTAEAFLLRMEERKQIMRAAKEIAGSRCTLIAHVGCISTDQTAELGRYARQLGYDAVSSVTPFYFKFSSQEIQDHYLELANQAELPVLLYHIPNLSGVSMKTEEIGALLEDERFLGVKFTSSDFFALERIKTAYPEKAVYNGFDEMFYAGIAMGADGGIGSTYNMMAEKFIRMLRLFREGKNEEVRKIQQKVNAVVEALVKVGVIPGEKALLRALGFDCGSCRKPFRPVTGEQERWLLQRVLPLLEEE